MGKPAPGQGAVVRRHTCRLRDLPSRPHDGRLLQLDTSLRDQLLSRVLMATMAETSLMAAGCDNSDDVQAIINATIDWTDRLTE